MDFFLNREYKIDIINTFTEFLLDILTTFSYFSHHKTVVFLSLIMSLIYFWLKLIELPLILLKVNNIGEDIDLQNQPQQDSAE